MAKSLALQQIPTLNPEEEEPSAFDRGVLRVINNNFRSIAAAMGGTLDTSNFLDNNALGDFTGSWQDYTPGVAQPSPVTTSTVYANYMALGDMVVYRFYVTVTSAGTAGNAIYINTPSNISDFGGNPALGSGYIFGGGTVHQGAWCAASATAMYMFSNLNGNVVGATPSFALAAGNTLTGVVIYKGV